MLTCRSHWLLPVSSTNTNILAGIFITWQRNSACLSSHRRDIIKLIFCRVSPSSCTSTHMVLWATDNPLDSCSFSLISSKYIPGFSSRICKRISCSVSDSFWSWLPVLSGYISRVQKQIYKLSHSSSTYEKLLSNFLNILASVKVAPSYPPSEITGICLQHDTVAVRPTPSN